MSKEKHSVGSIVYVRADEGGWKRGTVKQVVTTENDSGVNHCHHVDLGPWDWEWIEPEDNGTQYIKKSDGHLVSHWDIFRTAKEFCRLLKEQLDPSVMAMVSAGELWPNDVTDATVLMDRAIEYALGRPSVTPSMVDDQGYMQEMCDHDMVLFEEAWAMAEYSKYDIPQQ